MCSILSVLEEDSWMCQEMKVSDFFKKIFLFIWLHRVLLRHMGSLAVARDLVPWTRDGTRALALGACEFAIGQPGWFLVWFYKLF